VSQDAVPGAGTTALRVVIAILLIGESLLTGTWIAARLPVLAAYPITVVGLVVVRGLVGAWQFAGGYVLLVRRGHPAGAELAAWSLIASAVLLTIELGAEFSPSSLFPSYRWPVIGAYWAYAIAAWWWIRRRAASPR
jgi:hypothetical protein